MSDIQFQKIFELLLRVEKKVLGVEERVIELEEMMREKGEDDN